MKGLDKLCLFLARLLVWVGGAFLLGMVGLTCANIFLRLVWLPVGGTFELMGYFGSLAAAFALGLTQVRRGHIAVDVLVNLFSRRGQRLVRTINGLACFLFACLCAWQIALKATVLWQSGEVTETLRIVYYPFTYGVALGCAVLALVFLADLIKALLAGREGEA